MGRITPCLWFDTQAKDAAEHYVSIFENSRILDVSHYGEGTPRPADLVLAVRFELDGQEFMALNGGPEFTFDEAVSFQVPCRDQAEVDHFWERLGEGGEEGRCSWLKDKFGLWWQIIPNRLPELLGDPDPERAKRAMQAMMTMTKIDVAALERAADGETG
jgi:predicted 3-demethylubiquinone-9 3-methyltransferase (glyoxalase superfamily)